MASLVQRCASGPSLAQRCAAGSSLLQRCADQCPYCEVPIPNTLHLVASGIAICSACVDRVRITSYPSPNGAWTLTRVSACKWQSSSLGTMCLDNFMYTGCVNFIANVCASLAWQLTRASGAWTLMCWATGGSSMGLFVDTVTGNCGAVFFSGVTFHGDPCGSLGWLLGQGGTVTVTD